VCNVPSKFTRKFLVMLYGFVKAPKHCNKAAWDTSLPVTHSPVFCHKTDFWKILTNLCHILVGWEDAVYIYIYIYIWILLTLSIRDHWEHELLKSMDSSILSTIVQQKNITKQINNQLATFCQKFTQGFLTTHSVQRG